eukprot:NODE_7_length_48057_cov_0.322240.p12 type:complete len:302 gc:universal NODE_7_length_48057_cov_0.322240:14458-15363(+)
MAFNMARLFQNLRRFLNNTMLSQLAKLSRWDKPVGTLLLFVPCQWGLYCTDANLLKYTALFAIGSVAMRGVGCTINDIWDCKYDRLVERTKERPIANNKITIKNAILWSGAQSLVGLGVLLQLPFQTQIIALSSVPLVLAYPLFKRVTFFPQAILGCAFNYGALVGCSLSLPIDLSCALLFANGWCWTMIYDTLYAHQDKVDDLKIGIKSTALKFGNDKSSLYLLTTAQFSCLCGLHLLQGTYLISYSIAAILYQTSIIHSVKLDVPKSCKSAFDKSVFTGILIALGLLHDRISNSKDKEL